MTYYDAADNSRKCHALAVRETRLNNIRTGRYQPRMHVPDEVKAWEEGRRGRRIIAGALGAAFSIVAGLAYSIDGTPPAVKSGALAQVQQGVGP